jgi:protein-arginine kinase activator protein McsA
MSQVRICDKCDCRIGAGIRKHPGRIVYTYLVEYKDESWQTKDKELDFCDECNQSFKSFIRLKKEHNEI